MLPSDGVSALFQAALEATEEAVYNSLFQARTMTGMAGRWKRFHLDRVKALLRPARPPAR